MTKHFQRKGLGVTALKTILGLASDFGTPSIRMETVTDDGVNFHPMIAGALPIVPLSNLPDLIEWAQNQWKKNINYEDHAWLSSVKEISRTRPYLGFRLLSQRRIETPKSWPAKNYFIGSIVSEITARDQKIRVPDLFDLIILPGEVSTRKLLEKRLGQLPPFRPITKNHPTYGHIVGELTAYSVVAPRLGL